MSLGSVGCQEHPTVERGIEFLLSSVRADSSWSNTPNRAVSNSALALNSLATELERETSEPTKRLRIANTTLRIAESWDDTARPSDTIANHSLPVLSQRCDGSTAQRKLRELAARLPAERTEHVDRSFGRWLGIERCARRTSQHERNGQRPRSHSFDHDRTRPMPQRERIERAAGRGVVWLMELQNEDGGWATFYRDDALLRRDESGTDVTAQALGALAAWRRDWRTDTTQRSQAPLVVHRRAGRASDREWLEVSRVAPTGGWQLHSAVVRQRASSERNKPRLRHGSSAIRQCRVGSARIKHVAARRRLAAGLAALQRRLGTTPRARRLLGHGNGHLAAPGAETTQWPSSAPSKKPRSQLVHSSPWPIRIRPLPKPSPAASRGSPPPWNKTPTAGPQSSVSR